MKNKLKYESYKVANNLLKEAKEHQDLPRCIAAIAISESIITDRLESYLNKKSPTIFFHKGKPRYHVSATEMVKECLKHFPNHNVYINSKLFEKIESKNLFEDIISWLKSRNVICHDFVKVESTQQPKTMKEFHLAAINVAEDGIKYTKLITKWHKQQLHIKNK